MSTVQQLVKEYESDRNCSALLWIKGEDITENEKREFLMTVLVNTWTRAFLKNGAKQNEKRLRELLTWDKPRNDNEMEHVAKIAALESILSIS